MPTESLNHPLTTVGTTKLAQLGTIFVENAGYGSNRDPAVSPASDGAKDRGDREWIYVYNDSGSALALGNVVCRKAETLTYNVRKVPTGFSPEQVVGVAQHTIPDLNYGWVLRKGAGEVLADNNTIDKDEAIKVGTATAGTAEVVGAVTQPGFGWAIEDAAGAALATCYFDCRG